MGTRREFVAGLSAFAAASRALAAPFRLRRVKEAPPVVQTVYFGTGTGKGGGKGIYRSTFDHRTGQMSEPVAAAETVQPSYLALGVSGSRRTLYAVNEASDGPGTVSSFAMDGTGGLREIGKVSSGTAAPTYISVDATGRAAFVANYGGGTVSSYRVQPDGTLSGPVEQIDFHDAARFGKNGPNGERQDGPHPHAVLISPDNRFLVVNDLGHDAISVFVIEPETAKLTAPEPHLFMNNRPGSGTRHAAFHPNGRWLYSVNELESTVDHSLWTATHGKTPQALIVLAGSPVSTMAEGVSREKNTAAEIAIGPGGYHLYVSNRGEENSLVVFAIDQASGALKLEQRIDCGGKTPRHFTLDPSGGWLVCGNQGSGTVTVFKRDAASGKLAGPVQTLPLPTPLFTLFA